MMDANTNWVKTKQFFTVPVYEELAPPTLQITAPLQVTFQRLVDFAGMQYGGGSTFDPIDRQVFSIPNGGCTIDDFAGVSGGSVVIFDTTVGPCDNFVRAYTSQLVGAAVALFGGSSTYNSTRVRQNPWLASSPDIIQTLCLGVSRTVYLLITSQQDLSAVRIIATGRNTIVRPTTINICYDSPFGDDSNIVLVGAHLDSVPEGPGVNDNGTGTASILEIAMQIYAQGLEFMNKMRFCWWSAEEIGLLGSRYYAQQLSAQERAALALNINLDMVGSPNYVTMIYDAATATNLSWPVEESLQITNRYVAFMDERQEDWRYRALDGRSDYLSFLEIGVASGGLSSGSNFIKTVDERTRFGGLANAQMDPAYHQPEDTIDNINDYELLLMAKGTADAVEYWGSNPRPSPSPSPQ